MKRILSKLFSAFLLCFLCHQASAQELLNMLDGNKIFVNIIDTAGAYVNVEEFESKKGKKDKARLPKEDVFSIVYRNGQEVYYYKQDSTDADDEHLLTREEMKSFLAGLRDGKSRYRAPLNFWICFSTGLASGIFLPIWLSPLPPFFAVYLSGSRWITVNREHVSNPDLLKDEFYIMGYERASRSNRYQNGLTGAGSGLVLGILASYTLLNNQAE